MKKALLTAVLVAGVTASPAAFAAGTAISDDIKFEMKDWSPDILVYYEYGPRILPKDFALTLDPFPANSSPETAAELETLKKMAAQERTPEQMEKIRQEDATVPLYQLFSANGFYDFDIYPATNSLLAKVDEDVSYFILREKMKFQRARPTQLMPALTTAIDVPKHPAYPSGHAAQVYASALVLSEADPANKDKYMRLAQDVAHRREIAGLHYPSDTKAGQMLASQVVKALLEKEEIRERIAAAKKEFEAQSH